MSQRQPVHDDELVLAAKSGDPAAWQKLYEAVGGRLIGWLRSQTMHDAALDAEDIASEAWLTAARRISGFSGDLDDFAAWLFVIARNITTNANRRSIRRATTPTATDPRQLMRQPVEDEPDEIAGADWIRRTLSQLPPRERDVVAAIDIAGLDIEGTSRLLSVSKAAVRIAHHRAMRRLEDAPGIDTSAQPPTSAMDARLGRMVSRAVVAD